MKQQAGSMKATIERIRNFNYARDWDQFHSPENLAKSVAIEAGELLECFQWSADFKQENVKQELADVLIYCTMLADKLGLDPLEIMNEKMSLNEQKYPVEKSRSSSKKYTELGG